MLLVVLDALPPVPSVAPFIALGIAQNIAIQAVVTNLGSV